MQLCASRCFCHPDQVFCTPEHTFASFVILGGAIATRTVAIAESKDPFRSELADVRADINR
jgi:hypothetical protein